MSSELIVVLLVLAFGAGNMLLLFIMRQDMKALIQWQD